MMVSDIHRFKMAGSADWPGLVLRARYGGSDVACFSVAADECGSGWRARLDEYLS